MSSADDQTSFGLSPPREDEFARGTAVADGRFTIEALRGRGGMATVYLAADRDRGIDVALKIIGPKYAGKPAAEQRLRNEGMFAERIGAHPNVARPLESGRLTDGRMYLVTEFVRGPSLADLLAMERRIGPGRACRLARDVAAALEAIHAHGVVHRDVKPDNVVVAHDGDRELAKLVDFGLAAEIEPAGERLTAVHERPGTRLYMAPEQLAGARNAAPFDIYALGITLFEMLCGFAPNESRDAAEMMQRKLEQEQSIAEFRPDLPPELVRLVDECMAADPGRRVASATAVRERLDGVIEQLGHVSDAGPSIFVDPTHLPAQGERRELSDSLARRRDLETTNEVIAASTASKRWLGAALVVAIGGCLALGWQQGWWTRPRVGAPITAGLRPLLEIPAPTAAVAAPSSAAPAATSSVPAPTPAALPSEPVGPAPTPARRSPPATPTAATPSDDACAAKRSAAQQAYDAETWTAVLETTQLRACFPDRQRRTLLRVTAFTELERWADCLREGERAADPKTRRLARLCREQSWREQEGTP